MGNKGKIIAVDIHKGRLMLVKEECKRLGITSVEIRGGDLRDPSAVPPGPSERILLDAPCSGLGVLRRHPDAKWRRRPEDIPEMETTQKALLRALVPHLSPGGILLYSVCTHTIEETEGVLEAALRELKELQLNGSAKALPTRAQSLVGSDGIFRSLPHLHHMDGFTAFRLQKR
jgi:16S rRNA (cytosine967-C5)-methyltransferase